jgi:hypothetical protein
MKIEVVSMGIVERADSPKIHYPPGRYDVADDIATALLEQGVLAPEPVTPATETPATDDQTGDAVPPGGRKGKGA